MKKLLLSSLVAVAFLCLPAFASDLRDIQLLQQAKISLSEAIAVAEASQNGKALSAEIDDDYATPTYSVKIVKDGRIFKVKVDGMTKAIVNSYEDIDD